MAESTSETSEAKPVSLDDSWDDEFIIKTYDDKKILTKEALAQHIALATNSQHSNHESDDNSNDVIPEPQNKFEVGNYARATYEDGIDYEAEILSIDEEADVCIIKYVGYENEQEVALSSLVRSWGKKERRKQCVKAKEENAKNATDSKNSNTTKKTEVPFAFPPPPPLPFNPTKYPNIDNAEPLSAMLLSWYMSGFYTGVYQGIQMAKNNSKEKK